MKLDYEKHMKALYIGLYECAAAPAAVTEQMVMEMLKDIITRLQKYNEALRDKARLISYLTDIYNTLYDDDIPQFHVDADSIKGLREYIEELKIDAEKHTSIKEQDNTIWDKALADRKKLESELATLRHETSGLRFAESRALEKRVDVWADKAVEYRTLLGAVVRNLRCKENMSEVADLADFLEEELEK